MMAAEVKYKQTKFLWLPEIPEHWKLFKIKYLFSIGRGRVIAQTELIDDGLYPVYSSQTQDDGILGYINTFDFEGEMLTWTTDGVNAGSVFHRTGKFNTTNVCGVLNSKTDNYIKFLYYALAFVAPKCKRPDTNGAKIMNNEMAVITIPVPPLDEQNAIADYLDTQSAKITRFIQTKQRFIELLKEQRQSIITNAVTKGIDDGVKMKETVLCEIPEHWEVRRLKFLAEVNFSTVDKHSHKEEKQVRLCNYVDVYKHEYITNDFDFMIATATEAEIKRFTVEKGDVIITKDSETAADIAIPALVVEDLENVVCAYHLAHIKPNKELIESEFLFRLFQSKKINSHFEVAAKGVTRHGLSYDDINSVFLPYPPTLTEQQEIINHIKTETRTLDIAISKAEREIDLIKEYREAMIAEAVTGKMKL